MDREEITTSSNGHEMHIGGSVGGSVLRFVVATSVSGKTDLPPCLRLLFQCKADKIVLFSVNPWPV